MIQELRSTNSSSQTLSQSLQCKEAFINDTTNN